MSNQPILWSESDLGTDAHPFGPSFRPLTTREAEQIVTTGNLVVRNLRISQGYNDLKMGMTSLIGPRNVNWCAFANWASFTAGYFIRGEFVPGMLHAYLDHVKLFHQGIHMAHRLLTGVRREDMLVRSVLVDCIERVIQGVVENVALGNKIVFEEIGMVFVRLIETFRGATTYDHQAIERFLSALRPGPVAEGGQDMLIKAFRSYYQAIFEQDPKKKAELVLLGNNLVGYHEQTRLQEPIFRSLNAPIAETILRAAQDRSHEVTSDRFWATLDRVIDRVLSPLAHWLQREWANVATRWLMRIELPTGSLSLGKDLPRLRPGNTMFPEELTSIENEQLGALLYGLDYTPDTTDGSAAQDWGSLADRMNFVVDFFRAYQQDMTLYKSSFDDQQVTIIRAGGIPAEGL